MPKHIYDMKIIPVFHLILGNHDFCVAYRFGDAGAERFRPHDCKFA